MQYKSVKDFKKGKKKRKRNFRNFSESIDFLAHATAFRPYNNDLGTSINIHIDIYIYEGN